MTPERRRKLEAAGYVQSTPEEMFGLTEVDRQVVAFRLALARQVRRLRRDRKLTQHDVATIAGISQSRMTGIERGENVSLESVLTAYIAAGGELPDFGMAAADAELAARPKRKTRRSKGPSRPKAAAKPKTVKGEIPT